MPNENQFAKSYLYTDLFFIGFTLIAAQIILIREFLLLYNGNELVIGLLLTIWMLLTALGSWAGRFLSMKSGYLAMIRILFVVLTVYPILAVFSIEYFRNDIFGYGRMASLYEIIVYSIVLLFPICFSGGFLFTMINKYVGSGKLQNCYAVESFGSLCGGVLVSLYFIYILKVDNFRSLTYLVLINFVYFGISDFRQRKQVRSYFFLLAAIGLMYLIYNFDPGRIAKERLFAGQELVYSEETIFGNLSVTKTLSQLNFYDNGIILFSGDNVEQREEDVHYAMLQKPNTAKVLLIGGGVSGTLLELLKYPDIEKVTYLEINPELIELASQMTDFPKDKRIKIFEIDPIVFIKQTIEKFDVILVNLPGPVNAQLNRYYTLEFYEKLKRLINPGGLISTRLESSANYLSDNELTLQASIYNSLKSQFSDLIVVQGRKNYFLASDSALHFEYVDRFSKSSLPKNEYVNAAYLNDELMEYRFKKIIESYSEIKTTNRDFKPAVYLFYIRHWMSYYGNSYWIIPVICFVIMAIFLLFSKPQGTVMFTSGFTGAGTELVLLIVFQIVAGYVYLFLGVIITIFMAGLMIGAFLSQRIKAGQTNKYTLITQLISGLFIIFISISLTFLQHVQSNSLFQFIISLFTFVISILVGFQYGISVSGKHDDPGKKVAAIYSSDLVGSSIGSLLVAILIIPLMGIHTCLYLLAGLHFLTLLIYYFKRKIKYL